MRLDLVSGRIDTLRHGGKSVSAEVLSLYYSSIPHKRPAPKEGVTAKPAPTTEEVNEWKEGLEECMEEVKKLEVAGVKY